MVDLPGTAVETMPRTGQAVKEMLLELAQTDETIIPPFGVEKIQRTIEDIKEHHTELSRLTQAVEAEVCALYNFCCTNIVSRFLLPPPPLVLPCTMLLAVLVHANTEQHAIRLANLIHNHS